MNICLILIGAFVAGFAADFAWARYVKATGLSRAVVAANWSVAVGLMGLGFLGALYTTWWAAVPYMAGLWLGTYAAVRT